MKKLVLIAGAAAVLIALSGCLEQGGGSGSYKGPLFRYHFIGRAGIGKDGTAGILKQIDAMKETATLRGHFAGKLAAAAAGVWKNDLPPDATPQPELLRPLIEDLVTHESVVEILGPVGRTETLIALLLTEERARVWDTNLVQLAGAWKLGTPTPLVVEGAKGWAARRAQAPGVLQVFRVGKWTIVGLGSDRPTLVPAALQAATRSGRPVAESSVILDLKADLPALGKWLPVLAQFPLPPVHLTMAGKGDNLRTEMRMMYAGAIPWKFERWQIPTNLISEPLTSFTVAQGVRPILERLEGLPPTGLPLPNQFCTWGVYHQFGHSFFAMPDRDASNSVARLASRLPGAIKPYFGNPIGKFTYLTNRGEIVWGGGLPGVSPTVSPARSGGDEFLFGRLFPLSFKRTPAPAELYAQLGGRTDLLYYDWEVSSNRVGVARNLYQLANMFDRRPPPSIETPSQKWLEAIAPKLGNTVTEITMTSPRELLLTRKSQVGLTGFEMATLSVWLESPAFPYRIELPQLFQVKRPGQAPGKAPDKAPGKTPVAPRK